MTELPAETILERLHGASTVMPEYVDMINRFGGKMEEAVGIPEEQLRRAAESAVCKITSTATADLP